MMVSDNTAPLGTAFTVSVDARRGVTTGISAYDRAVTIRTLVNPLSRPDDLTRPGHIFPLKAMPGGVLRRAGHTEAAIDLARLAGCAPAGVICEVLNDEGGMARVQDLLLLAKRHGLKCNTNQGLIETASEGKLVRGRRHAASDPLRRSPASPTRQPWRPPSAGPRDGDVRGDEPCCCGSTRLLRPRFRLARCDCGSQLHRALAIIGREGSASSLHASGVAGGGALTNCARRSADRQYPSRPPPPASRPTSPHGSRADPSRLGAKRLRILTTP